jgi:hypothetical protein
MKSLLSTILFISSTIHSAEVTTCDVAIKKGTAYAKTIRESMKVGKDIDFEMSKIEEFIKENPTCVSYQKLGLQEKDILKIRKFMYAPDRSFNLPEDKCTEHMVDTRNMPKNNNQGRLGWCFAYSATNLFSFYEKTPFSLYDVALFYHNHLENREKDGTDYTDTGGDTYYAMEYLLSNKKGLCLESEVNYTQGDWNKLSDIFLNMTKPNSSLSQIICENKNDEKEAFKGLSDKVIQIIDKLSAEKRSAALLDILCKNRKPIKGKYSAATLRISEEGVKPEMLIDQIDKILEKDEPLAIIYSSKLLKNGVNFKKGEFDHASNVIGRKFNKVSGQCEYLIKNTWGEKCKNTYSLACDDGNYWVPRTALKNNIYTVDYLEANP